MALRATATATLPLPPPPCPSSSSFSCAPVPVKTAPLSTKQNSRFQPGVRGSNVGFMLPTSATFSLVSMLLSPSDARAALSKEQIVSSLTQVEQTIDQVQEAGSGFLGVAQKVFETVLETVKPGVDAALPVLKQAGEEALKAASPVVSQASKQAQQAIQSAGIDTDSVLSAAKTVTDAAQQSGRVIEEVKPLASTISTSDPIVVLETAAALVVAYLVFPPIWSAISYSLRGYKGSLTPAQTLDLMCTQNYYMIDVRSEKDKSKSGIPRLPPSANNRMIAIPLEDLPGKLRSQVRNGKKVEAEIAALKISYLKKLGKSSNIVIMDSNTGSAKTVAKTLTSLGFSKCWIVKDGFSGWLQSRLGTDSYNFSFSQILSPSRIIPAGSGRFGTSSTSTVQTRGKFLPGSN